MLRAAKRAGAPRRSTPSPAAVPPSISRQVEDRPADPGGRRPYQGACTSATWTRHGESIAEVLPGDVHAFDEHGGNVIFTGSP